MDLGELVEHWTLVASEIDLAAGKHRDTRLGFALLLEFYGRYGRFPRGRADLPGEAVEFVAKQVGCDAVDLGFYGRVAGERSLRDAARSSYRKVGTNICHESSLA